MTGIVKRLRGTFVFQSLMLGAKRFANSIEVAIAAGAANVCEITLTVADPDGNAIAGTHVVDVWLSDAATGLGLTATSASGTVGVKATTGTEIAAPVAKKSLRVATKSDGTAVISITDTAKTGFYLAASVPGINDTMVTRQLVTSDYGV